MCAFLSKLLNVPTEPEPRKFNDPVFLLGAMRSGTTLLMNTLAEHPQLLKVGFELSEAWTKIGGAPIQGDCLEVTEADLKPEYGNNMTAYFMEYLVKSKSFIRHLSRMSQKSFYGSGGVFYDWDDVYLLNKNPHLSNKVRYINGMYPNAKYIVIVRSPLGQSASLKMFLERLHQEKGKIRFLPENKGSSWKMINNEERSQYNSDRLFPGNTSILTQAWLNLNYTMFNHLEKIPKDKKVIISYEELMHDRPSSLKKIFKTLNLKEKHNHVIDKIIEKERKIHNTSTSGDPLKKWQKHLNEREQKEIFELLKSESSMFEFIKSKVPLSDQFWDFKI